MPVRILCIIGPTASGKTSRAIEEALTRNGEVISVDSRQVYRGLDIGTEKVSQEEIRQLAERGVPHHLIDIRDVTEPYSAGDFAADASRLIEEIAGRGKLPILVGGTHFYFDALLHGLPHDTPADPQLREELEALASEELLERVRAADPRRADELNPQNRRRLVRALEIIATHGVVPRRKAGSGSLFQVKWVVVDLPREELRARIDARLVSAFERGLIEEVRRVREEIGDPSRERSGQALRLNELGLEYRVVGEFLRGERSEASLLPALSAKLWQYARRQKAWLKKLTAAIPSPPDRS